MNVLVTGGTGFIGSRLARRCIVQGEQVRVLAQANTDAETANLTRLQEDGCEVVLGSITDPTAVREAASGTEVIYHLAAAQHEAGMPDDHFRQVNVEGTRTALEAAAEMKVQRFVHGSTIGVYRAGKGYLTTEDSPTEPDNIYGVTKLEAEELVRTFVPSVPAVIVRITETYGPGDHRLLKLFRTIRGGRYFHIGASDNLHHPIYVDDLVEALRRCTQVEGVVGKTFVAPGHEALTTRQMVETIAKVLEVDPPSRTVPLSLLWQAAVLMEMVAKPFRITPPLHRRRMHFFVKSFRFDGSRARTLLGMEPRVSFEEGARRTVEWYRKEGLM